MDSARAAAITREAPLADWRFAGEFRRSQHAIFDAVGSAPVGTLHLVAPPGSGKTLVGLELARRAGARAVALAPTTTIRSQWARTATQLAAGAWETDSAQREAVDPAAPDAAVSEDARALGDFTALTYQMLAVLESSNPFDELAEAAWIAELVEAGRDQGAAERWLAELGESNRAAYASGIRRRAGRLRKDIVRADPMALEAALHPNARDLIGRLADHGVTTVILDECHHLLDHWAIVVHCLLARIRERGHEPLVIGLTATLPSEDDRTLYENYTGLLGEVDYELPTPAVVKEGNLAPYRDFAWFVTPTPSELSFLRTQDRELAKLIEATLAAPQGLAFLEESLVGAGPAVTQGSAVAQGSPVAQGPAGSLALADVELRLGEAFKADFAFAEAAARVLAELAPRHPIVRALGAQARELATSEQRIRVLARYALTEILPDPAKRELWSSIRAVLADFGFHLTDRGVRRGRDPIDQILATSAAKDDAIGEILRHELAGDAGGEIRAVVLVDFAVHGHGAASRGQRAGALRSFGTVVADPSLVALRPVLVTAKHLRVAARDAAELAQRFAELLGAETFGAETFGAETFGAEPLGVDPQVEPTESPDVVELRFAGVGPSAIVAAASRLVAAGHVRLLVGTRGLLGEGWDCPAINTLIDLSVAATSSATQQLRGRTLRLDPAWPEKVAHNWTVTSVIEADVKLDGTSDLARLARKHGQVWGIARDETGSVVRGLSHTLTRSQGAQLAAIAAKKTPPVRAEALNIATVRAMPARAETRAQWGIGEPYLGEQRDALAVPSEPKRRPFVSSLTLECVLLLTGIAVLFLVLQLWRLAPGLRGLPPTATAIVLAGTAAVMLWGARDLWRELWRAVRQRALPGTAYQGAALSIARVLHSRGFVAEYGRGNIVVVPRYADRGVVGQYEVEVRGGALAEQRLVLDSLEELLAPVRTPRFLLEVGAAPLSRRNPVSWLASRLAAVLGFRTRYLPVSSAIGKRRADAELFAREWGENVGPCTLREIDSPEKLALLTRARKRSAAPEARTTRRDVWA